MLPRSPAWAIVSATSIVVTPSPDLDVVQLAPGVFAAIRKEPLSLAVNSNSLIIVRDTDVVVVDAQFTRSATRETIVAIR